MCEEKIDALLSTLVDNRKLLWKKGRKRWNTLPPFFMLPQDIFVFEVVGSKWKTSVSFYLAYFLSTMGKTGLFISPHLVSVRERIQLWQDGKNSWISSSDMLRHLRYVIKRCRDKNYVPSYFEAIFMTAVRFFEEEKVEFAVFEAGLGGRYDATNSIDNDVVVITRIEKEHTSILGDTYDEILQEKAAVIKDRTKWVFVYENLSGNIYEKVLRKFFGNKRKIFYLRSEDAQGFAIGCLREVFGKKFFKTKDFCIPGRRQCIRYKGKDIFLDVAHTPKTIGDVINWVGRRKSWIISLARDKRVGEIVKLIFDSMPLRVFGVDIGQDRYLGKGEWVNLFGRLGVWGYALDLDEFRWNFDNMGDMVVVGSHSLVGEVMKWGISMA